jgi:hypothetical protein
VPGLAGIYTENWLYDDGMGWHGKRVGKEWDMVCYGGEG